MPRERTPFARQAQYRMPFQGLPRCGAGGIWSLWAAAVALQKPGQDPGASINKSVSDARSARKVSFRLAHGSLQNVENLSLISLALVNHMFTLGDRIAG